MMRGHRYAMQGLSGMFEGRRAFNRDEAVRLARDLEAGFDENLLANFAPGTWVAGSRTSPWAWRDPGAFKGLSDAARQAASNLAAALEKEPTSEDVQQEGVWIPDRRMMHAQRRLLSEGLISLEALKAYGQLNATCHTCHGSFRGPRW
jgi:cytochrome c556